MRSMQLRIVAGTIFFLAAGFFAGRFILAAQPSVNSSVYLSSPIVATSTTFAFVFQTGTLLPANGYVQLSFDPDVTVPSSVTPADGSVLLNGVSQTLGTSASNGVFGYAKSGNDIRVTLPNDLSINANTNLEIVVGRELGFITPATTGSVMLTAKFYDAANVYIGGVQVPTFIAPPLGVSASISGGDIQFRVTRILPELRVGPSLTNNAAPYFINVRYGNDFYVAHPGSTVPRGSIIASEPALSQAGADGSDTAVHTLSGLIDTSYDIGVKTDQHLTRILRNVPLSSASVTDLNFTDPANGPALGSQVLLAGDINGAGTDPTSLGDDVINSVDLSILLLGLDAEDLSHAAYRANLNKDDVVNSVDLSIMLKNLDVEGDR